MRKIRKTLAFLLAGFIVASMMTGCGPKQPDGKEQEKEQQKETDKAQKEDTGKEAKYEKGQFKLRLATVTSGTHAWVQMGNYMAEQLKERSNGAIELTVFPGGQLGNDEQTIDDMRVGALDIVIGSTLNASPFVGQFSVLSLPYLFPDRDVFEKVLVSDHDIFKYYEQKYEENKLDLVLLALNNGGQRDMHTNKPINSLADLKNLKMRITSSAMDAKVWESLGTLPMSMSFNDIYAAISNNTAEAFECTLAAFKTNALYEVAKYHIKTAHQLSPSHISMSKISYEKLPEEFQQLIRDVSTEVAIIGNKIADDADDTLLDEMVKEHDVIVCEPDVSEFKAVVQKLYPEFAAQCKGQDILEIINKEIAACK